MKGDDYKKDTFYTLGATSQVDEASLLSVVLRCTHAEYYFGIIERPFIIGSGNPQDTNSFLVQGRIDTT